MFHRATALMVMCCLTFASAAPQKTAPAHGKDFWLAIAKNEYAPPAGESAASLAPELSAMLGSPDPQLRDEIAYSTFVAWIYRKHLLNAQDLRPLIAEWRQNLTRGVGSVGDDSVLLRSFSALLLSVVAASDNASPLLDEEQFRGILRDALAYEDAERDLRGFEPGKGWIHSAAHTADLLKFLARSRFLAKPDQAAILAALNRKLHANTVFVFGEDERMARAVLSLIARPDFDQAAFQDWLAQVKPVFPEQQPPPLEALRSYQNLKNVLAKLEVILLSQPAEVPHAREAAALVQATLKDAF